MLGVQKDENDIEVEDRSKTKQDDRGWVAEWWWISRVSVFRSSAVRS